MAGEKADLVFTDPPIEALRNLQITTPTGASVPLRELARCRLVDRVPRGRPRAPDRVFLRLGTLLASRYYPPDLGYLLASDFLRSVVLTLQMSLLGGLIGVLVAIPLAWFSARNVTPGRRSAYPIGRSLIVGSRAIHETIWTVLFVMVLGFGMLSGVLASTMFCVGFAGKLFTDEIEAIDMGPVEALRSVGAGPLQVFQYGVVPQVRVAFAGIAIYTWDVAFRAATVVGFFGGGGMGLYLKRTCNRSRPSASRRSSSPSSFVTVAELGSGWLRSRVHDWR